MCQLTLVDLGNKRLNTLHLLNQMTLNSYVSHQDGFGIFQPGNNIFKCAAAPVNTTDFGEILRDSISNNRPVIGHVRRAASGVGGFKVVEKEKSHPFKYERLILFHNGVLSFKDPKKEKEEIFKGLTDSACFGYLLNEEYKGGNMVEALNKTMEQFQGTFAFIIYSIPEDKIYFSIGTSKKLSVLNIYEGDKKIGLVCNTDFEDLYRGINLTSNFLQLSGKIGLSTGKLEYLSENSISCLENQTIIRVGDIKENKKPDVIIKTYAATVPVYNYENDDYDYDNDPLVIRADKGKKKGLEEELYESFRDLKLELEEFDELCFILLGKSLCELEDKKDLEFSLLPLLETLLLEKDQQKNIDSAWEETRDKAAGFDSLTLLKTLKLQFPYFLNDIRLFIEINKTRLIGD